MEDHGIYKGRFKKLKLIMSLSCEFCDRKFPTNASLYVHKQTQHSPPKLLIMNHDHANNGMKNSNDDELDNSLEVVDEYRFDKNKKRKRIKDDLTPPIKKRQDDFQTIDEYNNDDDTNDDFHIVDEYIDDDGQDDKNFKIIDEYKDDGQDDSNLKIIDEYNDDDDGQDDNDLKIIDKYDYQDNRMKNINYKRLYEDCLKSSRRLREKIKKIQYSNNKRLKDDKLKVQKAFKNQKLNFDKQINEINDNCKEKVSKIESECDEKINQLQTKYRKEYKMLEDDCEEKIKKLRDHIKSLEEDDESLNSLTDAIFNCTSMQEIFEIMHLVKNHRIDVVVQRHLKTLQNLLLSLSFGVLPICQPQREKITNKQRELVEKIQSASPNRAKGIMKEHRDELTNLFAIIEDSLNLARDSYNKYGTDKRSI